MVIFTMILRVFIALLTRYARYAIICRCRAHYFVYVTRAICDLWRARRLMSRQPPPSLPMPSFLIYVPCRVYEDIFRHAILFRGFKMLARDGAMRYAPPAFYLCCCCRCGEHGWRVAFTRRRRAAAFMICACQHECHIFLLDHAAEPRMPRRTTRHRLQRRDARCHDMLFILLVTAATHAALRRAQHIDAFAIRVLRQFVIVIAIPPLSCRYADDVPPELYANAITIEPCPPPSRRAPYRKPAMTLLHYSLILRSHARRRSRHHFSSMCAAIMRRAGCLRTLLSVHFYHCFVTLLSFISLYSRRRCPCAP